ncbi:MAG: hypothetical protein ACRDF0_09280, partial [Candidatus Limnocylindria bacterium]
MELSAAGALAVATAVSAAILAPFARRLPRPALAHPERSLLEDAGWRGPVWRWEGIRAGTSATAIALGVLAGAPALGAAVVGIAAPSLWLRLRADRARERARGASTELIRVVQRSLSSGIALPEALRRAVESSGDEVAARPFRRALAAFGVGAPLDDALR